MDDETRGLIEAPLLVLDFDGTMADLVVDWATLKARLADMARLEGFVWHADAGLDVNLRRLRWTRGETLFRKLCAVVAKAERAGFDPASVRASVLDLLRSRGPRPTAVVSANTRLALADIFRAPVWEGSAVFIVGKEDVRRGKPDPEGLLLACERFGVSPAEAVFVGDAPSDRSAAAAAGIRFVPAASPRETIFSCAARSLS